MTSAQADSIPGPASAADVHFTIDAEEADRLEISLDLLERLCFEPELEGWNGLFVAAKTPKEIIDRLNKEAVAAARHPDTVKRFTDLAAEAVGSSPADQDAIVKRQAAQFRPIIQTIKLE